MNLENDFYVRKTLFKLFIMQNTSKYPPCDALLLNSFVSEASISEI